MFFQGLGMVAYEGDNGGGGTDEIFRPPYTGHPAPWIPDTVGIYDYPPGPADNSGEYDTGLIPFTAAGPPVFQPPSTLTYQPPTTKPTLPSFPRKTNLYLDPSLDPVDYGPGTFTETFRPTGVLMPAPPAAGGIPVSDPDVVPISLASPGSNQSPAAANTGAVSPLIWVALGIGALFLFGGKK